MCAKALRHIKTTASTKPNPNYRTLFFRCQHFLLRKSFTILIFSAVHLSQLPPPITSYNSFPWQVPASNFHRSHTHTNTVEHLIIYVNKYRTISDQKYLSSLCTSVCGFKIGWQVQDSKKIQEWRLPGFPLCHTTQGKNTFVSPLPQHGLPQKQVHEPCSRACSTFMGVNTSSSPPKKRNQFKQIFCRLDLAYRSLVWPYSPRRQNHNVLQEFRFECFCCLWIDPVLLFSIDLPRCSSFSQVIENKEERNLNSCPFFIEIKAKLSSCLFL